MLISLFRQCTGVLIDFVLAVRFKRFIPHNEPLTADQLKTVRERNLSYFHDAMNTLVAHSINETRVRLVDIDMLAKGMIGLLGLTSLVLFGSLIWTGATGILAIMVPLALVILGYALGQGKDLVKGYVQGLAERNPLKMASSLCLFFVSKAVLLLAILMLAVFVADPSMLLVFIVTVAGMIMLQSHELNRLVDVMLSNELTEAEVKSYLAATDGLYSEWALSHFDDNLQKGTALSIGVMQRYQFLLNGTDTKGENEV